MTGIKKLFFLVAILPLVSPVQTNAQIEDLEEEHKRISSRIPDRYGAVDQSVWESKIENLPDKGGLHMVQKKDRSIKKLFDGMRIVYIGTLEKNNSDGIEDGELKVSPSMAFMRVSRSTVLFLRCEKSKLEGLKNEVDKESIVLGPNLASVVEVERVEPKEEIEIYAECVYLEYLK